MDEDTNTLLRRFAVVSWLCGAVASQTLSLFADAQIPARNGAYSTSVSVADIDNDGDQDVFLGYYGLSGYVTDRLFVNDGRGHLTDVSGWLPPNLTWGSGLLEDVDGDGDPDIVVGGNNVLHVYLNDGRGRFADVSSTHGVQGQYFRLASLDCDGDGDPDFLGQEPRPRLGPALIVNDGTGRMQVRSRPVAGVLSQSRSMRAGDLDGDGDQDIILSGPLGLLINDGSGTYTDESLRLGETPPFVDAIGAADVDGDGDLDIVAGAINNPVRLYRNRGAGTFVRDAIGMPPDPHPSLELLFLDIDGDGDPDLVVLNSSGGAPAPHHVLLNHGGSFRNPAIRLIQAAETLPWGATVADLDGDGDEDILVAGGSFYRQLDETQVFTSLRRHLHTAPNSRIGQPLGLDAWHEAGYAAVSTPMVAALGPDLLPRPVPLAGWGGFWLAPPAIATLPVATTTVPQGHTNWTLAVPPAQWLVGRSLHFQALALPGHVPWHLTNAVTVTFVR